MNANTKEWGTVKTVAAITETSVRWVWNKTKDGTLPQPVKWGPRTTRWDLEEVRAALRNFKGATK